MTFRVSMCFNPRRYFYGQRLKIIIFIVENNGKVHLHLIIQYEKIRTFWDPIDLRENGRSRGTNKGRSLYEFIRCRITFYTLLLLNNCPFLSVIYSRLFSFKVSFVRNETTRVTNGRTKLNNINLKKKL